jgi:VWFA-related protein
LFHKVFGQIEESMRNAQSTWFTALLLAQLLGLAGAFGQEIPAPSASGSEGMIRMDVVVDPRKGPPVPGLKQQDFSLMVDKSPTEIRSFEAFDGQKEPITVVFVIDAVNVPFTAVSQERIQIDTFLKANGGHLSQPVALAVLTEKGVQMQPAASTDGNAQSAALASIDVSLRNLRRSTGIWGADERLRISLNSLAQLAQLEAEKPGRKLIFWISGGWPLLSGPGVQLDSRQSQNIFNEVIRLWTAMNAARITLYALNAWGVQESLAQESYYRAFLKPVTKPGDVVLGNLGLQVLASQTGGLAVSSNDLASLLNRAMADTKAYYEITFVPKAAEHHVEFHSIEVRLAQPGLTSRTIAGYYTQPGPQ